MKIQLGERVLTSDGQDAGVIDRVILDTHHYQVASVVLRKGSILHHDVEVDVAQFRDDTEGDLCLRFDAKQFAELPAFDADKYTTIPPELVLPEDYPRSLVLWPGGFGGGTIMEPAAFGGDRAVREELVGRMSADELANAVIGAGSDVRGRDDEKIGELARLTFTEPGGYLASIVVREGFLFPREVELPGTLVASADDGVLYLNVAKSRVEELVREHPEADRTHS